MGVYDTVSVPCPKCGALYYAQSKGSYDKAFRVFEFSEMPDDVMSDVNRHAPFECENCGVVFEVSLNTKLEALVRVIE